MSDDWTDTPWGEKLVGCGVLLIVLGHIAFQVAVLYVLFKVVMWVIGGGLG